MVKTFVRIFSAIIFLIASSYMFTSGFRVLSGEDDIAIFFVYIMLAAWVSSLAALGQSFLSKEKVNE